MKARRTLLCVASFIALVLLTSGTASAQDVAAAARANRAKKEAAKGNDDAQNEWYKLTNASISEQGQGAPVATHYEFSGDDDLKISWDILETGKRQTAEIMVINGRRQWMLAKNVPLMEGYEIDALDGPFLDLKLVLELLRAAVPGGPGEIREKTTLDVKEDSRSIAVNTASASGGLEAPWTLRATIEPVAVDQWSFKLSVQAGGQTMHINGAWQKRATPAVFADDMPLDGWQILSIGPIKRTEGNATIYDYGAQISNKRAKTLGELRKM